MADPESALKSPVPCPNCGAPAEGPPVSCRLCGYRSEIAPEYLWLYGGGGCITLLGFALGAAGVASEGARPGHWSERCQGWFPLWPWPASYHWLSLLVAGIAFTLIGLGITRRRRVAWLALLCLCGYQAVLAALALAGLRGGPGVRGVAVLVLLAEILLLALAARLGFAFRRTPPRDIVRLQKALRGEEP
jgi:hypothetical protein